MKLVKKKKKKIIFQSRFRVEKNKQIQLGLEKVQQAHNALLETFCGPIAICRNTPLLTNHFTMV